MSRSRSSPGRGLLGWLRKHEAALLGTVVGMFTVGLLSQPKPDKFPRPMEVPTTAWVAGILVALLSTRLIKQLRA